MQGQLKILMLTAEVDSFRPQRGDEWRAFGLRVGLESFGSVAVAQWGGRRSGCSFYFSMPKLRKWMSFSRGQFPLNTAPFRRGVPTIPGCWDLVVAYQIKTARWGLEIPASMRLLDLTDSLGYFRRQLPVGGGMLQRLKLWGIDQEEISLGTRYDECWVAAPPDCSWLHSRGLRACVVPNGVVEIAPLPLGDPTQLLFVGNLNYLPNRLGLRQFLETEWGKLLKCGYRLQLAGNGTQSYRYPGVTGHGFVEDLHALYQECGIVVSPVSIGGGTPTKILEGLAHARPVVAWESGLAGLTREQAIVVQRVNATRGWGEALDHLRDDGIRRDVGLRGMSAVSRWGVAQKRQLAATLSTMA